MSKYLIKNVFIVSDGTITKGDVLVVNDRITLIGNQIHSDGALEIQGEDCYLLPGVIDAQVHFRDPGLTHKGDLSSESKAAIAGGVTSIIDMPNTLPNVLSFADWKKKYEIAQKKCFTNFAFLMGINTHNWRELDEKNLDDVLALTDDGLYFSGKGNLLAQYPAELRKIMLRFPDKIIALHCEDEHMIDAQLEKYKNQFGEDIPFSMHHEIRSAAACLSATQDCIGVAQETGGRLHILHLTSGKETTCLDRSTPFEQKRITSEVCVQNLLFSHEDYESLGCRIKWNPSIKTPLDRAQLWEALLDDRIDLITTDHAPHTWEEKDQPYLHSLSGAPMVQHGLNVMIDFYQQGKISMEKIVEKMCHRPAQLYGIKYRGFIREGMKADLVLMDPNHSWTVSKNNILYKCGWSPLEGKTFHHQIRSTWVNGNLVFDQGKWDLTRTGEVL